ncbi:hypothetical protein MTO96_037833 [Rhipicephalus appendiculatus]
MAVALISLLLLTQVCFVIKPLNKDAAAYFSDSNACEVRDMETVLRQFLSTSMDPQKCPPLTEPDFSSLFNCQQWTLGGADAADDIRVHNDRGDASSVGHGTGDMAVALISLLLLTQVCVVIKPLNKDAAAYFTDSNACELRDMETVLRQFLSTSMDPQKCPALTQPEFSSLFNCQQWTLRGADAADDIRLHNDRGGTSSVGHGTGDMAVALISLLLLTQVCVVIKPLNKDAAAYFTDSNACEVRDMETVLRQFLSTSMDPQKCPALTKPIFHRCSTANNGRWAVPMRLMTFGYKWTAATHLRWGMEPTTWRLPLSLSYCLRRFVSSSNP